VVALLLVALVRSAPEPATASPGVVARLERAASTSTAARPAAAGQAQTPPATGTPGPQRPAGSATAGQPSPATGDASGQEVAGADVDRIKKALEHPDLIKLDIPSALPEGSTRYKVQVQAYSFKLPTLAESLHIPWAPTPPGGLYNYEIMQMITPPEVRGSAPFTNGEMAWVAATSLLSALAMREVTSAYRGFQRSWRTWQEEQAHEEVQRDLAEFLRQQAAAKKAGAATDPAKKPPDKKEPVKK
jgi:hypothetical protein